MQKTIGFIAGGLAVIGVSGCDGVAINPPIKDGCYYLKDAPIVKIEGSEAKFLAPGTIKRATVERQGLSRGEHIYVAKFTPGFVVRLVDNKPHVDRLSPWPHVFYTTQPSLISTTIMAIESTDPATHPGLKPLTLGKPC